MWFKWWYRDKPQSTSKGWPRGGDAPSLHVRSPASSPHAHGQVQRGCGASQHLPSPSSPRLRAGGGRGPCRLLTGRPWAACPTAKLIQPAGHREAQPWRPRASWPPPARPHLSPHVPPWPSGFHVHRPLDRCKQPALRSRPHPLPRLLISHLLFRSWL